MSNLIEEIRSGNKDAVKAVYSEYAKDVYNFAKSITGDHDSALAATKKTFVKLFNNIKKGEEPDNFRTALLKVAYDEACSIAMPPKEEAAANVVTPKSIDEIKAPKPQREEIYMPKGGYDSLQVEEPAEETVPEEEAPRPKRTRPEGARPRRPRPEEATEGEEAPRPRRPRPEESAEGEEAPRRKKQRPVSEDGQERKRRPRPVPMDEEEAPAPRKRRVAEDEELPPIETVEEEVDVYDALDEDEGYEGEYDEEVEYEKPRSKGLFIFCIILNVILILILLWFLGGLLINLGVLPEFDLGYSWFNGHIYPLF